MSASASVRNSRLQYVFFVRGECSSTVRRHQSVGSSSILLLKSASLMCERDDGPC